MNWHYGLPSIYVQTYSHFKKKRKKKEKKAMPVLVSDSEEPTMLTNKIKLSIWYTVKSLIIAAEICS